MHAYNWLWQWWCQRPHSPRRTERRWDETSATVSELLRLHIMYCIIQFGVIFIKPIPKETNHKYSYSYFQSADTFLCLPRSSPAAAAAIRDDITHSPWRTPPNPGVRRRSASKCFFGGGLKETKHILCESEAETFYHMGMIVCCTLVNRRLPWGLGRRTCSHFVVACWATHDTCCSSPSHRPQIFCKIFFSLLKTHLR